MIVKMRSITMKKQPADLKIQKPLSLYPMKFDEVVDILLATLLEV